MLELVDLQVGGLKHPKGKFPTIEVALNLGSKKDVGYALIKVELGLWGCWAGGWLGVFVSPFWG